jgi:hypothetical protein
MMIAGAVLAVMLVSVWLLLMNALSVALIDAGLAPVLALVLVAGLNSIVAAVAFAVLRTNARKLALPATLRSLLPKHSPTLGEPL